ncbi:MAG: hypothetical protein FWF10_09075 [Clostridiales bacterium]|nr:hypothetical protein [Clostridiales bacterium]
MKRRCTERVSGIAVDVDSGRKTDDTGEGLNHYLKFAYLAEGAEYTKEVWITKRQYKTMHRSQELTICYNPLKPKQCYVLEIKFRLLFTLMFIAVGIILILAFL